MGVAGLLGFVAFLLILVRDPFIIICHWCSWMLDLPSQISLVFYAGLEGLGGLEMETDENENVSGRSNYIILD
jgi:hypothetical protein